MTTLRGARRTAAALLALAASGSTADCGTIASASGEAGGDSLHLGYYASVTHARAVYAVGSGTFQKHLGYVGSLLVARA